MGYCFLSLQKVKTLGQLKSKFNHNHRVADVENADPMLKHLNKNLIQCQLMDGTKADYATAWNERIDNLDYYKNHKVYANAVKAMEIVMTFSREDNIDIDAWQKKNIAWLEKTFNVAGDGHSNIMDVTYHADEPGNVHLHAIVIPIDENGHLNASRFTNGSRVMSEMQSSYAKDMEEFGLERGLRGSKAKHKDIRKFYAELNRSIESVPEPKRGENAYEYKMRVLENLETTYAAALRNIEKEKRKQIEDITTYYQEHYSAYRQTEEKIKENTAVLEQLSSKTSELKEQKERLQKEKEQVETEKNERIEELHAIQNEIKKIYELTENVHQSMDNRERKYETKQNSSISFEQEQNSEIINSVRQELLALGTITEEEYSDMMNKEYYKKICEKLQESVPEAYQEAVEKTVTELGWSPYVKETAEYDLQ